MIKKHTLIMILCCAIPIAGLMALSLFRVPLSPALWFLVMLLCPILHLVMMKYMMHGEEHDHHKGHAPLPPKSYGTKIKD